MLSKSPNTFSRDPEDSPFTVSPHVFVGHNSTHFRFHSLSISIRKLLLITTAKSPSEPRAFPCEESERIVRRVKLGLRALLPMNQIYASLTGIRGLRWIEACGAEKDWSFVTVAGSCYASWFCAENLSKRLRCETYYLVGCDLKIEKESWG
ncbi:hypothetical protein Drorol1_Dr00026908 [Drosera rotundifolia]